MLSVYPSHAVVVEGLDGNVAAASVSDFLKEHGLKPMSIDRNAILKFKRHAEVVPGLKKLKTLQLGGLQLAPERYRRLEQSIKDENYDVYGEDEVFDGESLRQTMKDYMHMDPATRFQIARNSFERAVANAKATNDESFLFDEQAPAAVQKEIKDLLASPTPDTDRLFELFLQREDMLRFSHDFRELSALVGNPADATDSFNWHNFSIDTEEELVRLRDAMIASEQDLLTGKPKPPSRKARLQKLIEDIEKRKVSSEDQHFAAVDEALREEEAAAAAAAAAADGDYDDDDDIKISQDQEASLKDDRVGQDIEELADEESSPENIVSVTDRNGYVWSGLVINTDTTQTTLPSGRLLSHRALVMVGNLKGAGGFGMGKGENAQMALKRAFRDAVKNIVFIDLYDNFGLAHDLYGRHNACHVYIKATPRERPFVGSPLARQILNRFGISTASVRIVGRRDPYAVCRAITYALQKHQNLDEFARDRGLRYLTLRWIYDNKI
jgi:small subunit ribosomal protein S5